MALQQRVNRGLVYLNTYHESWYKKVTREVNMAETSEGHLLAQVFGSVEEGAQIIRNNGHDPRKLGLLLFAKEPRDRLHEHVSLSAAWKEKVKLCFA